eukprot:NODE_761_length_1654_cov_96.400786_g751_i0.p1 GENE.NODE_761_length_1654_cov_96.400786_g751_i0~~NODE_761_length_1654_cov_96.400786_g751_i0.p1  ORF type:complete len:530 (+),score=142.02 NODE_761_length_1654_cov_96.400786_g751_i0:213-1592(+)
MAQLRTAEEGAKAAARQMQDQAAAAAERERSLAADREAQERTFAQKEQDLRSRCNATEAQLADVTKSASGVQAALKQKCAELQAQVAAAQRQEEELQRLLRKSQDDRRCLHNQLQELKGNIRVYCRVRPSLDSSPTALEPDSIEKTSVVLHAPQPTQFNFDRVFNHNDSNAAVFNEVGQLVQSALDGYRVCVFAYGQTGSGKTFTMEGSQTDPGIIPLSVQHLFATAKALTIEGASLRLTAQFVEIYNETFRDLLAKGSKSPKVELRQGSNGQPEVNAQRVQVDSEADLVALLASANKNRSVGATQCNAQSSRSHSVFTLQVEVTHPNGTVSSGTLNMVDLAGSERLKASGAKEERAKETMHINSSLTHLGNVIERLLERGSKGGRSTHIPYRNSKLTHMLQSCLGGDSKMLMILNCSPQQSHASETLCSLRFGTKAGACCRGTATQHRTAPTTFAASQ